MGTVTQGQGCWGRNGMLINFGLRCIDRCAQSQWGGQKLEGGTRMLWVGTRMLRMPEDARKGQGCSGGIRRFGTAQDSHRG